MSTAEAAPATRGRRLAPDQRREQIVAAAVRLFEQRPYAQVSTVEIAEEAGIARGLINHYFGDKRGLYLEVVRHAMLLPSLSAVPAQIPGTLEERVDVAVAWFLDSAEPAAASYATVIGSEGVGDDEAVSRIIDEADDLAARRVLTLVGADPDDALALARVRCYGGLAKATVREWSRRGTLTREQAHALLRDSLLFWVSDVLT